VDKQVFRWFGLGFEGGLVVTITIGSAWAVWRAAWRQRGGE
jgi:hypothetical protein